MATTDCVDRVLEQIHLWEEAHERGDPELCAWLRLQYAELLWDDAQGIYEGHEEWVMVMYTLLRNSYPSPSAHAEQPQRTSSVSVLATCVLVAAAGLLGALCAR